MKTCLLFLLLLAAPLRAQQAVEPSAVFAALDAYVLDKDKGRAAIDKLGLSPAKLVEIVRVGREGSGGKPGLQTWKIKDAWGVETDLYVKAPAGYSSRKPAGVLIVLHGLGADGTQLRDTLYSSFAADNNLIIICPTAQKPAEEAKAEDDPGELAKLPHWWVYRPGSSVLTGLAELRRKFAVDDSRVFLSGYSMGGFGTWNIGLRYPDRFAALVPIAGGISRVEYISKGDKKLRPLVENGKNIPVYFVHGDKDDTVYVSFDRTTRDQLKEFGTDYTYVEVPKGRHVMDVREGSALMKPIHEWLKDRRRVDHPKKITYVAVGDYATGCWWARLSGKVEPLARFDAEAKGENVFEVSGKGAEELTIYLDETLVDFAKPVIVTCGGKELFRGKVEESLDAVLESWREREDCKLVYRARVRVPLK